MIKILSWLKKDEVKENEKLRKTERAINKSTIIIHSCLHFIIIIIIIIIIHTLLWHRLDWLMRKIYAMCVEWTKFSEV